MNKMMSLVLGVSLFTGATAFALAGDTTTTKKAKTKKAARTHDPVQATKTKKKAGTTATTK